MSCSLLNGIRLNLRSWGFWDDADKGFTHKVRLFPQIRFLKLDSSNQIPQIRFPFNQIPQIKSPFFTLIITYLLMVSRQSFWRLHCIASFDPINHLNDLKLVLFRSLTSHLNDTKNEINPRQFCSNSNSSLFDLVVLKFSLWMSSIKSTSSYWDTM